MKNFSLFFFFPPKNAKAPEENFKQSKILWTPHKKKESENEKFEKFSPAAEIICNYKLLGRFFLLFSIHSVCKPFSSFIFFLVRRRFTSHTQEWQRDFISKPKLSCHRNELSRSFGVDIFFLTFCTFVRLIKVFRSLNIKNGEHK